MPLAFVQVGAWLNMIDEFYQETQSISLSVEWTFNGDRPCSVCQFVSEQTDSGKKDLASVEIFSHKLKLASENLKSLLIMGLKWLAHYALLSGISPLPTIQRNSLLRESERKHSPVEPYFPPTAWKSLYLCI
jgi:hypothetical protein